MVLKDEPDYARRIRRKAPRKTVPSELDEVVVRIKRQKCWFGERLIRDGYVLDAIVRSAATPRPPSTSQRRSRGEARPASKCMITDKFAPARRPDASSCRNTARIKARATGQRISHLRSENGNERDRVSRRSAHYSISCRPSPSSEISLCPRRPTAPQHKVTPPSTASHGCV